MFQNTGSSPLDYIASDLFHFISLNLEILKMGQQTQTVWQTKIKILDATVLRYYVIFLLLQFVVRQVQAN